MIVTVFRTKDRQEMDGFPKVWIRECKNLKTLEKMIKSMRGGAWEIWKMYDGERVRELTGYKIT